MNRRDSVRALVAFAAVSGPLAALAQQQGKVWRIGFLSPVSAASSASRVAAFRAGLRELGYSEGKNIGIEFRWADDRYDRLAEHAQELVRLKVDVIVTHGTPGIQAAKSATATIPIVMGAVGDAVANKLVSTLARPGGNVTGSTFFLHELYAKRVELLKEILPRAKRIAFLGNPDNPSFATAFEATNRAVRPLGMELVRFAARSEEQLETAFSAMARARIAAILVQEESVLRVHAKALTALAQRYRLPAVGGVEFAEAGGLIGYGPSLVHMFGRAAHYVDNIFKGARPGELPVERPTRFELIVSVRSAAALGIRMPPAILARADRVIE